MARLFLLAIVTVFIFSCNESGQSKPDKSITNTELKTTNFEWLVGQWKRSNEQKGKETFENWVKLSGTEYNGIGFTMRNKTPFRKKK